MKKYKGILEKVRQIPIVDSHCHVLSSDIAQYVHGSRTFACSSPLSGILADYSSLLSFLAAGITAAELDGIRSGMYSREECRDTILKYLPFIQQNLAVAFIMRGAAELCNIKIDQISKSTFDELDYALIEKNKDFYKYLNDAFDAALIDKALLNMWANWGASYYGKYMKFLSPRNIMIDKRCYARIATFDSYSMEPFSDVTRIYSSLVQKEYDSFEEYGLFLEKLADFFVNDMDVKGFKISEGYFRKLDYHSMDYKKAKSCFKPERTPEEQYTLSSYITWKVFELANYYKIPVQIHTGELWGDTRVEMTNPIHLTDAIKAFPNLRFDLLHCGYPYMAETGIMAANLKNVYINMAYMPLRSLKLTEQWIDTYLNIVPVNRILIGTDVFSVECMYGCVAFIRESMAKVAAQRVSNGICNEKTAVEMCARILAENARELYNLGS